MKVFAGVDCGATNLRVGIVDESGNVLASSKISSPLKTQSENFAKIVKEQIDTLASQGHTLRGWNGEIVGIGVGTPGPLDLEKGLILPSANLGNTQAIDLKNQFDTEFSINICFDRDTNLALLGETWKGIAEGVNNAVMLTLGTGVGGAIMVNGKIDQGENGQAGEIGHMILGFAGPAEQSPTCGLGHQGCLEAFINAAKDLDELGTYLGVGLANIVDIFNPDKIIIGGGKINMGDFLPKAIEIMKQVGMKPAVDEVEVLYAKLGDRGGILGGARLAINQI